MSNCCLFSICQQIRFFFAKKFEMFRFMNETIFDHDNYLIDFVNNHMFVSKIKSCMFKYKQLYDEIANDLLNQLSFI